MATGQAGATAEFHIPDPGSVIKKIEHAADGIKHDINSLGDKVKHDIEGEANSAKHSIEGAANDAKHGVEGAAKSAVSEVEGAGKKACNDIEEAASDFAKDAGEAVQGALEDVFQTFLMECLTKARSMCHATHKELTRVEQDRPELVDAINEVSLDFKVGPVDLSYANVYSRLDSLIELLDKYMNNPPTFHRGDLIDMIRALGPTTVDFGINVEVVAVVLGSDDLGVGAGIGAVPLNLFLEIADAVLDGMGVPE